MIGMRSDMGNSRKINEDFSGYHEDADKRIFIIADGMGGHNAGELASKIAVNNTIDFINSISNEEDDKEILKEAIDASNSKIYELSKTDIALKGMGTTITACLVREDKMIVANIGDSRCYILKREGIQQVTKDHSYVQQLVDNGSITKEEAVTHPNKNIITRALGTAPKVDIDMFSIDLNDVYKVVLCTDGLTNVLSEEEICNVIIGDNCEASCRNLVELCKQKGGRDDITVIIFEGECKDGRNFTE